MIKKTLILILLITLAVSATVYARTFKIASYNVENLFDMVNNRSEYDQYIPGEYGWNEKILRIKVANLARVISDLNADVIALQEIETSRVLGRLQRALKNKGLHYPYQKIASTKPSTVKCAVLSKFPITGTQEISVKRGSRTILKVTLLIDKQPFILFVNHWKAKSGPESRRILYAKALKAKIDALPRETDFVVLGDFNSNYNEYMTFRENKRLNDTHGRTGINHVLKTIQNKRPVDETMLTDSAAKALLYNLWLELDKNDRWSYQYGRRKNSIDNILVPQALYDNKGVSYQDNSFGKFTQPYLFKNHYIYRWQFAKNGKGRHLGSGFSDHLPIYAIFTTRPFAPETTVSAKPQTTLIADLYKMNAGAVNYRLDNCAVIYKHNGNAIIKQSGGRAIFIYRSDAQLKSGKIYQLTVKRLKNFKGLREITQIAEIREMGAIDKWDGYFLNNLKIDLNANRLQNEVIDKIGGVYKRGFLHYGGNRKIRLHFAKNVTPKLSDNAKVVLRRVRIGFYKHPQIVIEKAGQIK